LVSDVQHRCEALLLQSQVQFVLSYGHANVQGPLDELAYPSLVIGLDQLIPVSAPDGQGRAVHQLPAQGKTGAMHLLGYSAESGLSRILRELKGEALDRLPVQPVFTAHLASVLRTMALDGRGLAWLPQILVHDDLVSGRLLVAAPDDWHIDLEIRLHRDKRGLGAAAEAFWGAARALKTD
jgi:DNA-binding transcriptional LysR family regulator